MNPGIYPQFPEADYFGMNAETRRGEADWIVSRSDLMDVSYCPAQWKAGSGDEGTTAMRLGSLVDCMVLTPSELDSRYTVTPETYSDAPEPGTYFLTSEFDGDWNGRAKACREWKAEKTAKGFKVMTPEELEKASVPKPWNLNSNTCSDWVEEKKKEGFEVVSAPMWKKAEKMAGEVRSYDCVDLGGNVGEFIDRCETQVCIIAEIKEPTTGITVKIRCLLDLLAPGRTSILDLKTAAEMHPRKWAAHIHQFGYDTQGGMYPIALEAATGEPVEGFGHLVVGSEWPHLVATRYLSEDYLEIGKSRFWSALKTYCECLESGKWPGWTPDGMEEVEPPAWLRREAA